MARLAWLVPGVLAGGPHPAHGEGGHSRAIEELRREGIGAIVSLTEKPLVLQGVLVEYQHAPTPDGDAPEYLDSICNFIDAARRRGVGTFVHCHAGVGRTGTVLAAWLIWSRGMTAWAAIDEVRATYNRHAVESEAQLLALQAFERRNRLI
jgi:atypical dual specificity phosphatase